MNIPFYFLTFLFIPLFSLAAASSDQLARRIQSHLTIHDLLSARQEAEEALVIYPQEAKLYEYYIRVC